MEQPQTHLEAKEIQINTSTEALRARIREYTIKERSSARASVSDSIRFGLGEIKAEIAKLDDLTEKDIHGLSTRIKRRKHATSEDMYRLSHAFLQSNENINAFANIPGALQVIIKELTGVNAERQVSAVECLCNLSLGEAHVCEKIANAAGSYLVTYLDSSETRLKRTSLWTLANLLATSTKATQTLLQMELICKLWTNYVAKNEDYNEDAAICLTLISANGEQILKEHDWHFIVDNIEAKNPTSAAAEYHLQMVHNFGMVKSGRQLNNTQLLYLINCALSNLQNFTDLHTQKERLRVVYAVRVLANLLAIYDYTAYDILLKQLGTVWQSNLSALFNKLFSLSEKSLSSEILWFLKNSITLQSQQGGLVIESFLQKLCLPKV